MTNKIPKIRFKFFSDKWEQKQLGEICKITMGQSPDGSTYSNIPSSYILVQGNSDIVNGWVCPRVWTTQKTKECEAGDLIMSVRAPAGTIGKTAYDAVIGRGVAAIKGNEFIFQCLLKMYDEDYWKKTSSGSTFESLNSENIYNAKIFIADDKEQEKIGEFFKNIDKLIATNEQKLEKLKNIKVALLEKMFPQNNETTPKIRFKDFNDKWKKEKITNVGKVFIGLVTTMTKYYTNEGTLLIRNSDIKDNCFVFDENPIYLESNFANLNASRKHKIGDIITVHTGDVGTSSVITDKEDGSIGFATIVTRPNVNNIYSYFLSTFFNSDIHKAFAISKSTGDGRSNYNLGDFCELLVPLTDIQEQKEIGKFFKNLNKLISLTEKKIEKLKNIKSGLLEKMFV